MVFSSAVITFRETLEAALVVGIILAFLYRVNQKQFSRYVYLGVSLAVGGTLAIVFALVISYLFFTAAKKVNLRIFFNATSLILVLFAAGLVAHGLHEFQEAQVLPMTIEHVWNTNWLLDEKGFAGSVAKSLFGYNGDPSLLEIIAYAAYLAVIGYVFVRMSRANIRVKTIAGGGK